MDWDQAGQEREPGAMAALGCLLAIVGLVAALIALYTVHRQIPSALDCPPIGPPDDPGPGLPDPTTLIVDSMYVLAYTCVFMAGFWVPWSRLGRRRLVGILAGCLMAPVALLGVATLDLAVHVAPENGLHFRVALPDHIRLLSPGPCPGHEGSASGVRGFSSIGGVSGFAGRSTISASAPFDLRCSKPRGLQHGAWSVAGPDLGQTYLSRQ